jgi:hypothetical protein
MKKGLGRLQGKKTAAQDLEVLVDYCSVTRVLENETCAALESDAFRGEEATSIEE